MGKRSGKVESFYSIIRVVDNREEGRETGTSKYKKI